MNSSACIVGFQLFLSIVLAGANVINRDANDSHILNEGAGNNATRKSNQGKWFELYYQTCLTWSDAFLLCKERHGNLATIETQEDLDLAKQMAILIVPWPGTFWIGGANAGSKRGFYWLEGGLPITSFWFEGYPKDQFANTSETCVRFGSCAGSYYEWGLCNYNCSQCAYPICEYY